jgi:uncharacterized protein YlxW (UPF0749 family)
MTEIPMGERRVRASLRAPRSQLAVSIVAFILGLLVVVQIRSQAGDSGLASRSAQDLTLLVANLNTRNDQLRSEVSALQRQLGGLELGGRNGTTALNEIRDDLARVRAWSGLDPVAGRGVAITISGTIAGPALEDLVNELCNAGAEALAIEDVRVVAATVVGGGAGTLSVDNVALKDPFVVRAIGNPESLIGSLTRIGGIVAQLAATYPDVTVNVEAVDRIGLPATTRDLTPSHGRPRL